MKLPERLISKDGKDAQDLIRDVVEIAYHATAEHNLYPSAVTLVFEQPAAIDPNGGIRRNEWGGYATTWPCWACGDRGLYSYCVEIQNQPNRYSVWRTLCDAHARSLHERYHGVSFNASKGRPSFDFLKESP